MLRGLPVRTELSRHFSRDADFVAVVLPSPKKDKGAIPKEVRDALAEAMGKLGKVPRKRVFFVAGSIGLDNPDQTLRNSFYELAEEMKLEPTGVLLR
jgi:hypothetical protein